MQEKAYSVLLSFTTAGTFLAVFLKAPFLHFLILFPGLLGLVSPVLALALSKLLEKAARLFQKSLSVGVLSLVFFLILTPLAIVYRLFYPDRLETRRKKSTTMFKEVFKNYEKKDFERPF